MIDVIAAIVVVVLVAAGMFILGFIFGWFYGDE